jgi:hypothetical protein
MDKKILPSFTMFYIFLVISTALAVDDPDIKKEKKFHNIYEIYNSIPTPTEKWEPSAKKGKTQKYSIQKGDTLWDISETLFGDGFFWSKVWSLNPNIKNPHEVSSGTEIQFTQGSGLSAPTLAIGSKSNDVSVLINQNVQDISKERFSKVLTTQEKEFQLEKDDKILPSAIKRTPLLKKFPQSIPDWIMEGKSDEPAIVFQNLMVKSPEAELYLPFFISENEIPSVGKVHEMELTSRYAGVGDYVFIDGAELKTGNLYTIYNSLGHVGVDKESKTSPLMIQVQGEVEIVGPVESLFKARVTKAIVPVEINSFVMASALPLMNMGVDKSAAATKNIAAEVIGGDFNIDRKLMAEQNILFLNKGMQAGLNLGDLVPIYATRQLRQVTSKILQDKRKIGLVKIVKVEANYATGVIVDSIEEIRPGDTTSFGQESEHAQKEVNDSLVDKSDDKELSFDE